MTILLFIFSCLAVLLVMLSQWKMRRFLLTSGTVEKNKGFWLVGNRPFIEAEYIRLTKEELGKIGTWFWLEVFSFISFVVLFIVFAWTVG